jgi:hypothetical protein
VNLLSLLFEVQAMERSNVFERDCVVISGGEGG